MLTRRLGRTGYETSLAILGGIVFHFLDDDDAVAAVLTAALDAGVTHLDITPGYATAEQKVGPHLPAVRQRLFISEKSAETTRDGVRRQLDETLRRLHVSSVDLYQLHGVTDIDDLDRRSGAVQALMEARDEGLCTWVGTTGHNVGTASAQHEAVRRYDLDTVMIPVYPALWADAEYRVAAEALLATAQERDLGVMAIKAAAARPWGEATEPAARPATTWYEPQFSHEGLERGIRFALSTPGVTAFCTPGDAALLPRALEIAAGFTPMSPEERTSAVAATSDEPLIFPIPT